MICEPPTTHDILREPRSVKIVDKPHSKITLTKTIKFVHISILLTLQNGIIVFVSVVNNFQKKRKAKRGASDPTLHYVNQMKKSQSLEDLDRIEVHQTITILYASV